MAQGELPVSLRKRLVPTALLALVLPSVALAQGGGPAFSLKGGAVSSAFAGADAGAGDRRLGFVAGASARLDSWAILTAQAEVLYLQKGTDNTHIDYVEVPLLARFALPFKILEPYVVGGPFGAFAVGCSIGGSSSSCEDVGVEGFDWGLALGGGLRLPWIVGLGLEARYDWSLAEVPASNFDLDITNDAWMVMASFEF